MKKNRQFFLFLFIAMLITGCAGMQGQKTAEIELEGNPTTGYTWVCTMSPEGVVREISKEYIPNETDQKVVGAGGKFIFTFEGISAGAADLVFSYLRTWEEGIPAIRTETYKAVVDGKNNLALTQN